MSEGSRCRRQEKRAAKFNRGLVAAKDLEAVMGMTCEDAEKYASENNLTINIRSCDGCRQPLHLNRIGPNILSIDIENGFVVQVTSNRRMVIE